MALSLKGGVSLFNGASGEIEIDGQYVIPVMPMSPARILKSYNTTLTDDFLAVLAVATPADFENVGFLIKISIHNRTGATKSYDWTLQNYTKSLNLISASSVSVSNRQQRDWYFICGIDKIAKGDFVLFDVTGDLGTDASEVANGSLELELIPLCKIKPVAEMQGIREI